MKNKIEKFEREVKEFKKAMFMLAIDNKVDLTDFEDEDTKMILNLLRFFDTSIELITEEFRTINEINEKLDKLMEKVGGANKPFPFYFFLMEVIYEISLRKTYYISFKIRNYLYL